MKKDKGCSTRQAYWPRPGPRAPCAAARHLGGSAAHADSHTHARASDSRSRIPAVCCIQLGTLPRRSAGGMIAARRSRGATARLMGAREPAWRRCAAGRVQQAAATTTAAKMVAVVLALLKVRTAVIAARDGGGGESMAVRGVAVAAVRRGRGAPRAARRDTSSGSTRAAAYERQHAGCLRVGR